MAETARDTKGKKAKVQKPKATKIPKNGENGEEASSGKRAAFRAKHIKLLATENPKRDASEAAKRFALYRDGMTVGEYLEAGGTTADVRWDEKNKFIELGD
jgi:hypothetical protein